MPTVTVPISVPSWIFRFDVNTDPQNGMVGDVKIEWNTLGVSFGGGAGSTSGFCFLQEELAIKNKNITAHFFKVWIRYIFSFLGNELKRQRI